ncbi:hypothetical protein Misp01_81090 [Microtetraspora sp. NBRC 13810]|uniref:helix-turn-helix domain-containing protein n=1 Tax=Microtetraspora sp. NBRC 13810 TaxID=3030990 RepID=UPI0024A00264|nr:helix-turn-helix transcriptional regulator [Microtetraspora sp. NBRC 13810]GLW12981.1 hypothetical protein Misp01_81090 [Microtetraspora sp. NBRC 13810]
MLGEDGGVPAHAAHPATVLPTTPIRVENIEPVHCEPHWHREYHTEDVLAFRDMARSAHAAGTLGQATGGSPGRSARYQEFMRPQGYADNLRAVFRIGDGTWGALDLFRRADRPHFNEHDLRHIAALAPGVAQSLAGLAVTSGRGQPGEAAEPPGTDLFDDDGQVTFADAHAERWFAEVCGTSWGKPANSLRTTPIYSVVARARAVAAERESGPAVVRLRGDSGRWFSISASVLRDRRGKPGPVSAVVEPATSKQIVPLIVEAYSLTPREREVTEYVARGHGTSEIATRLRLSPHTGRDHLKAIFAKVDVSSRGELVAKLFGEHYSLLMHSPDAELVHVHS